jgi:hypothetical protein
LQPKYLEQAHSLINQAKGEEIQLDLASVFNGKKMKAFSLKLTMTANVAVRLEILEVTPQENCC